MIKAGPRFSFSLSLSLASAMFIFLLCLTPDALAQGAHNGRVGSGSIVLSHTLPGLLAFAPGANLPQPDRRDKNGCDSRDRDRRSNCTAVPEGGTALAYLSLVALGCLATGIFRSRRQARLHETK
jgi:hypothetical protein